MKYLLQFYKKILRLNVNNYKAGIIKYWKNWAEKEWKKNERNWEKRSQQDKNYRNYLVQPRLRKVISWLSKIIKKQKKLKVIDIGCGDGYTTKCFIEILKRSKIDFNITCLDISHKLLNDAKFNLKNYKEYIDGFIQADITSDKFRLNKKYDLIFSSFLMQDLGDIYNFSKNIKSISSKNALHIHVALDPTFVDLMKKKGALKLIENKEFIYENLYIWRYISLYPIAEVDKETFYLPNFQRYIGDYINVFKHFGLVALRVIHNKPKEKEKKIFLQKNIPPFFPYTNNLYFPEILDYPSNFIIVLENHEV